MEDLFRAGGLLAVLREVRDLLDPAALTVTGRPLVDYLEAARIWDPEVIRERVDAAPGARRDRRPVRQPGPDRGRDQARRRVARAAPAPRPGDGLRLDRGLPRPDRRPRPRRRRRLGPDPARLRPAGLSGHARGGQPAAAGEAAPAGRPGHGPDLRWADERHGLRHGRPARDARRPPPAVRSAWSGPAT